MQDGCTYVCHASVVVWAVLKLKTTTSACCLPRGSWLHVPEEPSPIEHCQSQADYINSGRDMGLQPLGFPNSCPVRLSVRGSLQASQCWAFCMRGNSALSTSAKFSKSNWCVVAKEEVRLFITKLRVGTGWTQAVITLNMTPSHSCCKGCCQMLIA